jgi:hypothetical protein
MACSELMQRWLSFGDHVDIRARSDSILGSGRSEVYTKAIRARVISRRDGSGNCAENNPSCTLLTLPGSALSVRVRMAASGGCASRSRCISLIQSCRSFVGRAGRTVRTCDPFPSSESVIVTDAKAKTREVARKMSCSSITPATKSSESRISTGESSSIFSSRAKDSSTG